MTKKKFFIVLSGLFFTGFIIFLTVYLSCNMNTERVLTTVSTDQLVLGIENKDSEIEKFIEHKLEVSGYLKEIIHENNNYAILLKGTKGRNVLCQMEQSEVYKLDNLKNNQKITIRGVYKGYLNDVILLNCELLETSVNE